MNHDKHAGHSPHMFKKKFWVSLFLAIPTLVFSQTVQSWFGQHWEFLGSQYIPAIFGVAIFSYGGMVFLKGAQAELINKQPGMMTLISMAITVAFGYSLASSFGVVVGMDFWWELATLVTIMLLGHWLEMASVMNAQGALRELAKLLPDEAELINEAGNKKVPISKLVVGDRVLVRPGAQIPIDGIVINGVSDVNEAMLTGESRPVKKVAHMQVIGGTINGNGSLTIEVTKVGGDTALAGIMRLVAEAQKSKSKTQIVADRAAFYLTFIALGAAIITWAVWAMAGAPADFILERIVTVLVIACPHALGLAVPLVTAISTTLAAKNGLLIRQRIALETARNIDIILFDKTGTLTMGKQGVVGIIANDDEKELLSLAAAIEADSEHPIAWAIVKEAHRQNLTVKKARDFSALAGRGAKAKIGAKTMYVGGPRLVKDLKATFSPLIKQAAETASHDGKTIVYVIADKKVLGALLLADIIREESKEAIATLQNMGKRVAMLTGDSEGVASWVASELGIQEYFAEVLPEHKAETVRKLQSDGSKVAMIGDGVNDAPALTQADVGIAIGAGTDVAIESAGIILASDDPRGVVKIMRLSRATYSKMVQNLAWATGYNAIALPLAAGALAAFGFILSPAFGAVLMSLSTIIVAINAQLLRRLAL
jgi:Cu2+-exporting ATPase